MEKKTKKGTKKLLMSVMVMVIALVGAATSTFAWFTTSAAPRVDEFQVQVSTISGLYIAIDDGSAGGSYWDLNYKSYVTATEVYSVINPSSTSAYGLLSLVPYSTTNGVNFVDFDGNGALSNGAATGNPDYTDNDRAYFSFDLYFRGGEGFADENIVLDFRNYGAAGKKTYVADSGALNPMLNTDIPRTWINDTLTRPIGWIYDGAGILQSIDTTRYGGEGLVNIASGGTLQDNAANALRLSFIGTGDIAVPATTTTNIWDPRPTSGYYGGVGGNAVNNLALDLKNAFNDGILDTVPANYFTNHNTETQLTEQTIVTLSTDRRIEDGFFYGKLNVKIWIDGWDGDCLNAIMADIGRIALQFKIAD